MGNQGSVFNRPSFSRVGVRWLRQYEKTQVGGWRLRLTTTSLLSFSSRGESTASAFTFSTTLQRKLSRQLSSLRERDLREARAATTWLGYTRWSRDRRSYPPKLVRTLDDLSPLYLPSEYPDAALGAPGTLFKKEQARRYLREVGELVRWLKRRISKE